MDLGHFFDSTLSLARWKFQLMPVVETYKFKCIGSNFKSAVLLPGVQESEEADVLAAARFSTAAKGWGEIFVVFPKEFREVHRV